MSHPPVRRSRANPPDADAKVPWLSGLDGIRALAVAAVVLFHAGVEFLPAGFLGVDVFFVVSGFLITALLVAERERTGGVALAEFWKRRARRLLPALAALLIGTTIFAAVLLRGDLLDHLREVAAAAAYLTNWDLILREISYFEQFERPSQLRHLWSLAVEEQFYALWPLVFFAVLRLAGRRWLARLTWVAALGALASLIWMAVLYEPGADPSRVYFGSDARAFTILLGVLLGLHWKPWRRTWGRVSAAMLDIAGACGLAAIAVIMALARESDAWMYPWGLLALSLAAVAAVASAARNGSVLSRALSVPPLRWLGERSYAVYLWHWPVLIALEWELGLDQAGPALLAAGAAITLALAAASYEWVERPAREGRFREQFGLRELPVPRAVWAASAAVVIAAAAAGLLAFPAQRAELFPAADSADAEPLPTISPATTVPVARELAPSTAPSQVEPRVSSALTASPPPATSEPLPPPPTLAPEPPATTSAPTATPTREPATEHSDSSDAPSQPVAVQPVAARPPDNAPLVEFAVLPGDTPGRLAAAFGITLEEFKHLNEEAQVSKGIRIGQVLQAPCPTADACAAIEIAPVGSVCTSWSNASGDGSVCGPGRLIAALPVAFAFAPARDGSSVRWAWAGAGTASLRGTGRFVLDAGLADATDPQARVLSLVRGAPPLAIGDSVMAGAARALHAGGIEVDAAPARPAADGIAALRNHMQMHGPRGTVIFQGIGWRFTAPAEFQLLLDAAADVEHLIVLTHLFEGGHGNLSRLAPAVNEMLREQAERHPRVTLVDWQRLAGRRAEELTYDGAHLRPPGIELYVGAILAAVEAGAEDAFLLDE